MWCTRTPGYGSRPHEPPDVAGVPAMVHTEHGRPDPVPLTDRLIDNRASRWTDAVVAVSEALADVLRRQVVHDPSRVRVISNGVDTTRLHPPTDRLALRQELGIPHEALVIGSIGRLEPIKNYRSCPSGVRQAW